jgi:GMP synthase-like glutamine amidotransferase
MGRTLIIVNYNGDDEAVVEDLTYIKCVDLLPKTNTELAALLDGVSTLVLTGGPQHVPDINNHPELKREIQLIFLAAQRDITVIGICLGFQLINCAFGNPVVPLPEPIIGSGFLDVSSVNTYADPMLECIDFGALARGFSFHYDGVPTAVSPDLQVVATGPPLAELGGANGIIYFVKHWRFPIYGIQSHPEATLEGIRSCLARYGAPTPVNLPTEEVLDAVAETFFGAYGIPRF